MKEYKNLIYDDKFEICMEYNKNASMETIILHENTRLIMPNAFKSNIFLKEVILNKNLESIGENAFKNCQNLEKINLEETSLFQIESSAFKGCEKLSKITFPETLDSIKVFAFDGSGLSGKVILPENLSEIGSCAFCNTNVKSIFIGNYTYLPQDFLYYSKITEIFCKSFDDYIYKDELKDTIKRLGIDIKLIDYNLDFLIDNGKSFKEINNAYKGIENEQSI